MTNNATVGVLGLGKLGFPLALTLASAGHRVFGWDLNQDVREEIRKETYAVLKDEPAVEALFRDHDLSFAAPTYISVISQVIFVVVPTPSQRNGSFRTSYVEEAIRSVAADPEAEHWPTIALVSTVSPGSCRKLRKLANSLGLNFVYTPTMIALGSVVRDLRSADMQIIGQERPADPTANEVAQIWRTVAPFTQQVAMSYESAEITKLASNVFSTLKISFANILAQWCDQYSGADVDDVVTGLKLRGHIGPQLIKPGSGFGGPCLPRDTRAFEQSYNVGLGDFIHVLNREHATYVVSRSIGVYVDKHDHGAQSFAVLGCEYKEGANYRIESFGDRLSDLFQDLYSLKPVHAREADIVVIALPLRGINLCDEIKPGAVVYDLWRTHRYLDDQECPATYLALGVST